MAGLGLEGAFGVQGAYDALHQLIAQRQKEQILAQQESERQQAQALALARLQEGQREFDIGSQRADVQTKALTDLRDAQQRKIDAELTQQTQYRAERDKVITEALADPTLPPEVKLYLKTLPPGEAPTQLAQFYKEKPVDPIKLHEANRLFDIAHPLPERGGEQGSRPYYQAIPDTSSPTGYSVLDVRTNRLLPIGGGTGLPGAPGPGGGGGGAAPPPSAAVSLEEGGLAGPGAPAPPPNRLLGAAAKRAIDKVKDIDDAIANIDTLDKLGAQHNWETESHTGPFAGIKGALAGAGLINDPEGVAVRAAVGYVKTLIAHPLFGSAFTNTEKALMDSFVADVSRVGRVNKVQIDTMRQILENGRERWLQGIGPRTGGAGASEFSLEPKNVPPPTPKPQSSNTSGDFSLEPLSARPTGRSTGGRFDVIQIED